MAFAGAPISIRGIWACQTVRIQATQMLFLEYSFPNQTYLSLSAFRTVVLSQGPPRIIITSTVIHFVAQSTHIFHVSRTTMRLFGRFLLAALVQFSLLGGSSLGLLAETHLIALLFDKFAPLLVAHGSCTGVRYLNRSRLTIDFGAGTICLRWLLV